MRAPLPFALVLSLAACGSSAPPVCEAGRSQPCACADGRQGAQECGASGLAWGACVCTGGDAAADVSRDATGDAADGAEAAADVTADAPADASGACVPACGPGQRCEGGRCVADGSGDAAVDATDAGPTAPAPPLFRTCEPVGAACGEGLACVAFPRPFPAPEGGAPSRGICTRPCSSSAECRALWSDGICVLGSCLVECGSGADTCATFGAACRVSSERGPDVRYVPVGVPMAGYCGP